MGDIIGLDGRTLRRMRQDLGLSQEALAHEIGLSVATVNRWERSGIGRRLRSRTTRALKDFESLTARRKHVSPGYAFKTPSDSRQAQSLNYFGYEAQLSVAARLAHLAERQSLPTNALLFGYPGTGKTSFAQTVWRNVNAEGAPFSLLHIPCMELAARDSESARSSLEEVRDIIHSAANYPMVVLLDEVDTISRDGERLPSESLVCFWTMNLLRLLRTERRQALVVAASNYPYECDAAIRSELGATIYLDFPDERVVRGILETHGVAEPEQDARHLLQETAARQIVLTARAVADAGTRAKDAARIDPAVARENIAVLLGRLCAGPASEEAEEYERKNGSLIASARALPAAFAGANAVVQRATRE